MDVYYLESIWEGIVYEFYLYVSLMSAGFSNTFPINVYTYLCKLTSIKSGIFNVKLHWIPSILSREVVSRFQKFKTYFYCQIRDII